MSKKGTIVLLPFPFTDLSNQKIRPALIISNQSRSSDVVVVFITSQTKLIKNKTPFLVSVLPSDLNGLKTKSAIVCNKIATLNTKIILGELGEVEPEVLESVEEALKQVLGL